MNTQIELLEVIDPEELTPTNINEELEAVIDDYIMIAGYSEEDAVRAAYKALEEEFNFKQ